MNLFDKKLSLSLALILGLAVTQSVFALDDDEDDGTPVFQGGITKNVVIRHAPDPAASVLEGYDVVVLLDRSHSMERRDCPFPQPPDESVKGRDRFMSRWDWCRTQTMNLAQDTAPISQEGLTLVTFADDMSVYEHVGVGKIASTFEHEVPYGTTDTVQALRRQLDDYFKKRDEVGGSIKPLLIAIITDGAPNSPRKLRKLIASATHRMKSADEVSINFLQVGEDRRAKELFGDLKEQLAKDGAEFDIVHVHRFDELKQQGLTHTLIDSLADKPALENKTTIEELDDDTPQGKST